jgi:formylglycine-generating enzyme required for sulfatase activity
MISVRGVARAAVVAAMVLAAGGAQAAVIDTVPVGNPGNAADTHGAGYGAVTDSYNIGKYEVTAGQYTEFLNAVAKTDTYGLYNTTMLRTDYGSGITQSGSYGSYVYSVASNYANRPVNYVSWGDAARFANWLTNGQPTGAQGLTTTENGSYYLNGAINSAALMAVTRKTVAQGGRYYIPTENEWYKAAYHKNDGVTGNYWDYPTSSDTAPGQDMADASGNNANYWTPPYAYPIDSGKYTTVAGEFQNSDSPYGTFDQGGNVWEWNEAIIGSNRGLRGGAWFSNPVGALPATYRSYTYAPTFEYNNIGFRVSEVPEPATMSLLALGGLGMLMRRRTARR